MAIPLVSIITPTYNHARFIRDCIESVLRQTFTDWEQIIIDDASSDETCDIVSEYCKKDSRIKLIKQKHQGIEKLKHTYNKALKLTQGEFIAILEGDDYWPSNKLELQLPLFDKKEVVLAWGAAMWVNEECRPITIAPPEIEKYLSLSRQELLNELLLADFIPAVTVIVRKKTLLSIGGFQQPSYYLALDYPTWLKLTLEGKFAGVKEVVGYWRRHSSQMSTARQEEILKGAIRLVCDFYTQLPNQVKRKFDIDLNAIKSFWYSSLATSNIYEGRKKLIRKMWTEARKEFKNAWQLGDIKTKIKALIGILASYGHFDLEKLVTLVGKEPISEKEIWF